MTRKILLDTDPGIDDAVAMVLAMTAPEITVIGVTAVAGNVPAEQATRNVQTLIERLDPPRWPRVGAAIAGERESPITSRHLNGEDGLGDCGFKVADLHHTHAAEKVISEELRTTPESLTVITLGPLTNIARVFRRDPNLASQIGHLIMVGGAVTAPGNASPTAEFNVFSDPAAAREVFRSPTTKTLVPLDVTRAPLFSYDLLDRLPDESTRAGALLRTILPHLFRSYRHQLGMEGVYLHDAVGMMYLLHPELFTTEPMAADVETMGELTYGATIFDRRPHPEWRPNMDVVRTIDVRGVQEKLTARLLAAGNLA